MRRFWGYGLVGFGLFVGLGVLLNTGQREFFKLAFAFAVFGVLPVLGGLRLLRPKAAPLAADADRAWEAELMRLAERRGGALTVAEAVAHGDLEPARAESLLDGLCRRGLAEHRVTDDGQIVYAFAAAPTREQKRAAEGVLDD